jgi:hypothetical protein
MSLIIFHPLGAWSDRSLTADPYKSSVTLGLLERVILLRRQRRPCLHTSYHYGVYTFSVICFSTIAVCHLIQLSRPSCWVPGQMGLLCSKAAGAAGLHGDLSSERDPGSYVRACRLFSSWEDEWTHAQYKLRGETPSVQA